MARNQVCGPEPDRQRRAGPLHDRASRQRVIPLTVAAPQNVRPIGEAVGFAGFAAPSADKPIAPADGFKVSSARRIVRKQALELGQRTRKWQILARQDGSGHRGHLVFTPALPIVGLGVNRISWNDPSEHGYIERYCNLVDDVRQVAKLRWPAKEQFISIKILTRSTGDVVDNLGRVAAWYYERDPPVQLKVPEYSAVDEKGTALMHTVPCGEKWDTGRKSGQSENWYKCIPLLNIKKGCTPGESVKAFVSVLYQRETYCVPKDEREAGHTPAVFEIVHQLIAYDKVAKDLPAANILSVTPIP